MSQSGSFSSGTTPVIPENNVMWFKSATVPFDVIGAVPIFTVPTGKTFIPIDIGVVSVTTTTSTEFFGITAGFNAPTYDSFISSPVVINLSGVGTSTYVDLVNNNVVAPEGSNIAVNITNANMTAATGYFFIYGVLI